MKPAPRLAIHPMTDHESVEQILTGLACDFAQLAAIILAFGGFLVVLLGTHL